MEHNHTASNTAKQGQLFLKVKPHFNLRQTKLDVPTALYCVYTFGSRQWKIPTGVKVYPSQWDVKRQQAIVSNQLKKSHNQNNAIVNKRLAEPIMIQQPVRPTTVAPDGFMAHHDEQVRENVLLNQQNEKLASEVRRLQEQNARNKEQLQMLPSPFQTVLDEDKYMEMQKELKAYKQGIPYGIYHDESLNAELEATHLECESQYTIEEEKPDQE